jgi:preprotein translocase subunit Sss1
MFLDNLFDKIKGFLGKHSPERKELQQDLEQYQRGIDRSLDGGYFGTGAASNGLYYISKKYNLQFRFVPTEGHALNEQGTRFIKKRKEQHNLEKKLAVLVSCIGLIGTIIFLSPNLTGNVIAERTSSDLSLPTSILFIIGILGMIIYFRKK